MSDYMPFSLWVRMGFNEYDCIARSVYPEHVIKLAATVGKSVVSWSGHDVWHEGLEPVSAREGFNVAVKIVSERVQKIIERESNGAE